MFADFDLTKVYAKKSLAYDRAVNHAEDMSVHILGAKPVKLLSRVRPREDEEIRDYRLESYEPITTATADKAIFTVQKMMNPKLWSITFPDSSKDLEQYLFKDYPFYKNVMLFVNDVLIRSMLADPNGVVVVLPLDMSIDDTQEVTPLANVVHSSRIWASEYGKWYLLYMDQMQVGKDKWDVFHYVDGDEVVKLRCKKEPNNAISYEVISSYQHNIGTVPVWPLGGIIADHSISGVLYRSYFSAALPHWNKAISADSDLDGAFINHMHPIRVEVTEECDFTFEGSRCLGGKVIYNNAEQTCPGCHGTGRRSVKSPYGVYQVSKPGLGEQVSSLAPVSYVNVPTEPTRMLEERVENQLKKGLSALNMYVEVGENQSGIAKILDRSELYDFLLTLSEKIFNVHIKNIINYSAYYKYLNNVKVKLPTISRPVTFDLLSVQEEATVLKDAQAAGLSTSYIRIKMANIIQKDLFGASMQQYMAMDSLLLNTLAGFDSNQVIDGVNAGLIEEEDAKIYFNIDLYIQQLYSGNPEFYKLSYEEKRKEIYILAEEEEIEMPEPPEGT
jgi:hypothetical protein